MRLVSLCGSIDTALFTSSQELQMTVFLLSTFFTSQFSVIVLYSGQQVCALCAGVLCCFSWICQPLLRP